MKEVWFGSLISKFAGDPSTYCRVVRLAGCASPLSHIMTYHLLEDAQASTVTKLHHHIDLPTERPWSIVLIVPVFKSTTYHTPTFDDVKVCELMFSPGFASYTTVSSLISCSSHL